MLKNDSVKVSRWLFHVLIMILLFNLVGCAMPTPVSTKETKTFIDGMKKKYPSISRVKVNHYVKDLTIRYKLKEDMPEDTMMAAFTDTKKFLVDENNLKEIQEKYQRQFEVVSIFFDRPEKIMRFDGVPKYESELTGETAENFGVWRLESYTIRDSDSEFIKLIRFKPKALTSMSRIKIDIE